MAQSTLICGLLACARDLLLGVCESQPEHPERRSLADAADMAGAALKAAEYGLGAGGLSARAGLTFHVWSDGAAIGVRCERDGAGDYYLYLAPNQDARDGGADVFVCAGEHGNPARDETIRHGHLPRADTERARLEQRDEMVSVELPWDGRLQLRPLEAAGLVVKAYGERAVDISISGRRTAYLAYWHEVERLLGAPGSVAQLPGACAGRTSGPPARGADTNSAGE
jgi:hypothetical protein